MTLGVHRCHHQKILSSLWSNAVRQYLLTFCFFFLDTDHPFTHKDQLQGPALFCTVLNLSDNRQWHRINKNCPNSCLWRLHTSWDKETMPFVFSESFVQDFQKCSANCLPQLSGMLLCMCVFVCYFSLLLDPISTKHLARKTIKIKLN